MNSGFGKCKFPCRPTQLFAFRNSRSVSALFSQVSSSPFGDYVEKVINLSAQDKRFLNAIFAMQKIMFSHWKTQHSAFRNGVKSGAACCTQLDHFWAKSRKGTDLSAQDKRFLNAIFAMQKSMFSHWETQHSAFRKRCKIRCSMLHSALLLLGQKSKKELT